MRSLLAALVLTAGITGCQSNETKSDSETSKTDSMAGPAITPPPALNTLTGEEKEGGWQLLFDGTTKNGWHIFSKKSDGSAWTIADNSLHLDPKAKDDSSQTIGGGDLVSDEEYENFHLKLEWKLDSGGNSGIIFYIKEEAKYERTYHTGPEMQVLDNDRHKDGKIIKHRAADLYDLISSSPEVVHPVGEWNQVDIISNKGALEFHLNGTKVLTTTMWDDNWKKLVAGSKFKAWPDFGTYKKGRIGLQDHGNPVWYRNIKIKKL